MRSSLAAFLALALGVLAAPGALADAYDDAMAKAHKHKATAGNDGTAWQQVLDLYVEADALKPTKDSKWEVAEAAARLEQHDLAYESYEAALALGLSGKQKDKAQKFLDEHATKVARVDVRGPAGAIVTIGARRRGALPRPPIVVLAGTSKIQVSHDGRSVDELVEVAGGETVTFDAGPKLEPKVAPPIVPKSAEPSSAGQQAVPLSDTGAGARALGWSLIVGGGATIVFGGAAAIVSEASLSSRRSALAERCLPPQNDADRCGTPKPGEQGNVADDVDAIATWKAVRTGSLVGMGVGAMVLGVGIVRLLTAPDPPRVSSWHPTLLVGDRAAFVGVEGSLF